MLLELQGGGVWGSWFLIRGEVGVCPGIGLEGWLMCLAHPFGGAVCRGYAQYPPLALLQKCSWDL